MNKVRSYITGFVLLGISIGIIIWSWDDSWLSAISLGFLFRFLWWLIHAIYNIGLIFLVGYSINRKLLRRSGQQPLIWQAAYAWSSGVATFILMGIFLLLFKLYSPISWNIISLIITIMASLLFFQKRHSLPKLSWQKIGCWFTGSDASEIRSRFPLLPIVTAIFLLLAILQLFVLPNFRDELAYHLFIPRLWEYQHHFWMPADNFLLLFPANIEILWGFALAQGGAHMPRFISFVFGLLTLLCLRQTFKEWKINRWIIDFSTLFFLITPLALIGLAICHVEWPLFFFLFIGWHLTKRFLKTEEYTDLTFATICWGISLGIKYTALPIVGLLFLDWSWNLFLLHLKKSAFRALLSMLMAAMVFLGPWAIRNYLVIGNPFHPLTITNVFTSRSGQDNQEVGALTTYSGLHGLWKINPWLFHATFEKQVDERMHIGWPILLYLVLLFGWKWRKELPWYILISAIVLFFYFSPSPRIYFPIMGFCFLFLPFLINEIYKWISLRYLLQTLLLVYALPSLAAIVVCFFWTNNRADQDYLLGLKNDIVYLQSAGLVTPIQKFIREQLPLESRFWTWCEDKAFYFERWVLPTSPYSIPSFLKLFRQGGEKALENKIIQYKIDYLVINIEKCNLRSGQIILDKTVIKIDEKTGKTLLSWLEHNFSLLAKDRRFELYKVVPKN